MKSHGHRTKNNPKVNQLSTEDLLQRIEDCSAVEDSPSRYRIDLQQELSLRKK